jgi:hypothetical protein
MPHLCGEGAQVLPLNEYTVMESGKVKIWIKRLGFWGFMFFLVKGLLWLAIPVLIAMFATD